MSFKKIRGRRKVHKATIPKGAMVKKFSGREPRRVGESPWGPGQIPGGKIPHDKKPSVVRDQAAAESE